MSTKHCFKFIFFAYYLFKYVQLLNSQTNVYNEIYLQLQFAAILSSIYAIVMVIVMIGVVRDAIQDGLCSMTTIFLLFVASVFVISAILHPKVNILEDILMCVLILL